MIDAPRRWTADRVERFVTAYEAQVPIADVAERFGIGRASVRVYASLFGARRREGYKPRLLPKTLRPIRPSMRATILAALEERPRTTGELAELIGRTPARVHQEICRLRRILKHEWIIVQEPEPYGNPNWTHRYRLRRRR
jgi:hypothetical protein